MKDYIMNDIGGQGKKHVLGGRSSQIIMYGISEVMGLDLVSTQNVLEFPLVTS